MIEREMPQKCKTMSAGAAARIWAILREYRWRLAAALGALLIASACLLSMPQAVGYLIDEALASGNAATLGDALWLLLLVIVVFASAISLRTYLITWVGERMIADVRRSVYGHLLDLPLEFFETRPTGEIFSRLTADVAILQTMVGVVVVIALRSLIQLIGSLGFMLYTDPMLTGLVLLIAPPVAVLAWIFGKRVRRWSARTQERQADVAIQIEESLNAVRVVKSFASESDQRARFNDRVEDGFRTAKELMRARAQFTFSVVCLALGVLLLVSYVGGQQVLAGTMSGGTLTQFLLYASFAGFSIAGLSEVFGESKRAVGATERLFQLLDERPVSQSPTQPKAVPQGGGALSFECVDFAYPSRPKGAVLAGFTLSVRPGETVALVGRSGAGKTTLFQLLLRLYDPQSGRVTLEGVDLRDLDPTELRRAIAVVPQELVLFSGSILDNIRFGRKEATVTEVVEAAQRAQAHEFIEALPQGYSTPLGEKGQQLSTGQRQRLAIARAIVRRARILLLDEPAAFLDAESERLLHETLRPVMEQCTTLVIAHRLATITEVDRVVVMDGGRIICEGKHQNLLKSSDFYARLVAMEFNLPKCDDHPLAAVAAD